MQQGIRASVGICAYNEGRNIGGLLETLLSQKYGNHELAEIIIVASGCTDTTVSVVESFSLEHKGMVKLIVEPTRNGKAPALNRILGTYRGDVLVHLDADHTPSGRAIRLLLDPLTERSVGAVSGCQIPYRGRFFMDKVCAVIWELHNETQLHFSQLNAEQHLGGVLFAIRKGICDQIPEDIVNDDAFLGVQCRLKGYRVLFESRAHAFFQGPRTITDYVAQRRRVVYGHLRVKKQTGVAPKVLEMSSWRDKAFIISGWVRKRWRLLPYFIAACFLELWVNSLARVDSLRKDNPHKIWKIALSTKNHMNVKGIQEESR